MKRFSTKKKEYERKKQKNYQKVKKYESKLKNLLKGKADLSEKKLVSCHEEDN